MVENVDEGRRIDALLGDLSRGRQVILLLVVGLVSVGVLFGSNYVDSAAWRNFMNALATGLLVSAGFGLAQTTITGRMTTEVLRSSVVTGVNASLSESIKEFFPSHDFPESKDPSPVFNQLMQTDLSESPMFWFRGLTARYTAARLFTNTSNNDVEVRLILPDPQAAHSLDGRAGYEYRHGLSPGSSIEEVKARMRHNLAVGLTGLFDARRNCAGMEIIFTPLPLLDRCEIFQHCIWVTLFSDKGQSAKYPRTLRFGSAAAMYRFQYADCQQTRRSPATRSVEIPRYAEEAHLHAVLSEVMGDSSPMDVENLRREFAVFRGGLVPGTSRQAVR